MSSCGESSTPLLPVPSGRFISECSKHVKIIEDGLERLSEELLSSITDKLQIPDLGNDGLHLPSEDPRTVDWLFVLDSLNFCFWAHKGSRKWTVNGHAGYFALVAALKRALDEGHNITNPEFCSKITKEQVQHILRSDNGSTIPLLNERVLILNEIGQTLLTKYKGTFKTCIIEANKSAIKLLQAVVQNFPCFKDEALYQGTQVSFYKRAQILVADLWNLFGGKTWGEFSDIDKLSMFADYRVPQVLVHFGVLSYSEELREKLENDALLPNGSEEEVEIRGCSIEAIELIKRRIQNKMKEKQMDAQVPNSTLIDYFLWCYRRKYAGELEGIPFHKTLSIFY